MPWKRGQSGNPQGRPPNAPKVTAELRQILDEPVSPFVDSEGVPFTKGRAIAQRLVELCMDNDKSVALKACGIVLDRVDGRLATVQPIEEPEPWTEEEIEARLCQIVAEVPKVWEIVSETTG